ncbi:hypothetical protein MKX03_025038 [Papaver bracteatum]|nr:hypothetical protein MKX03_025038 [Papaver bracteatum]
MSLDSTTPKNSVKPRLNSIDYLEKETKKLQARKGEMKVDGSAKKKKGSSGFQVGKNKVKTKITALNKAKAAQVMNLDK